MAASSSKASKDQTRSSKVKPSKSRELRASVLYTGCDCEKRNGLQDDCQRSECHGSPQCLTNPPTCGPSEFSNGKHLGRKGYIAYKEGNGGGAAEKAGQELLSGQEMQYYCFPLSAGVLSCGNDGSAAVE